LGERHPELTGRIFVEYYRLCGATRNSRWEALIEGIGLGIRIVAEALDIGLLVCGGGASWRSGYIQVRSIPQDVGPRVVTLFDERASLVPLLCCPIEAVDIPILGRRIPQGSPLGTIIEPKLALRLLRSWVAVVEIPVAYIGWVGLRRGSNP
jgi:hypothetical protein